MNSGSVLHPWNFQLEFWRDWELIMEFHQVHLRNLQLDIRQVEIPLFLLSFGLALAKARDSSKALILRTNRVEKVESLQEKKKTREARDAKPMAER